MLSLRVMGACNVQFDLWPNDLTINRVITGQAQPPRLRAMGAGAGNVGLSLVQSFQLQGLKINMGHLLVTPSLHVKFEGHGCRQCQFITMTNFSGSRSLWPWPDYLKIYRGHLLVRPSLHVKFEGHGCRQCRVITLTSFAKSVQGYCDLWPDDLMTSTSIGFVYWSSPTSKSSLRTKGSCIVELSLGQAFVYRRTDRHVQSNIPLFFQGA